MQVARPEIIRDSSDKTGDSGETDLQEDLEDGDDFWHTSVGKFKISVDTLPQPLQYIYQLLKVCLN